MERTFYTARGGIADACDDAVRAGVLSRAEADDELEVLKRWDALLGAALARNVDAPRHLREDLQKQSDAFARLARNWLAIANLSAPSEPIRVAFVPSPGRGAGGGGANGGVLVIEIPEERDPWATLTTVGHELVHLLLAPKREEAARAAANCGLDGTTMSEAIAYAMAPGLFAYGSSVGALEKQAQRYANDSPSTSYARFTRLAVAIKPAVAAALTRAKAGERGLLPTIYDAVCKANAMP